MLKSKKFNGSLIAVVILSVLLTFATSTGLTLAWFNSSDKADTEFTMSGPINIELSDRDAKGLKTEGGRNNLDFIYNGSLLVPGMPIDPRVQVNVKGSTTASLLRALIEVEVDGLSGDDLTKVTNLFVNQLSKVANMSGWYQTDGETNYFYFYGNAETYSQIYVSEDETGATYEAQDKSYDFGDTVPTVTAATDSLASVKSGTDVTVSFLFHRFLVPMDWENEVAESEIKITITIEAIQDRLIKIDETDPTKMGDRVPNTVANAKAIFDAVFAEQE